MPIMIGNSSTTQVPDTGQDLQSKDPSHFYPALKKLLRQLCYTYLHFEESVEVVGLICVTVDHRSKDSYSITEVIRRGLAPKERTHERQQSDLEATELGLVSLAMNRISGYDGGNDGQSLTGEIGSTHNSMNTVSGGDSAVSSSLHASKRNHEGRTSWDGGGEVSDPTLFSGNLSEKNKTDCSLKSGNSGMTVSQAVEVHSQPLHSYDETDHAALVVSVSNQTSSNSAVVSSSKTSTHALSSSWLTTQNQSGMCMCSGSPVHSIEHCVSCVSGGVSNKVVVSGDGTVSHVVHNGPMSSQVYRIDLSSHEHSCDMDVNLGSLAQTKDGEQRDRAASIESTDSFMEVGILNQINHAQRLLASPTDQPKTSPVPSPVVSLVADSTLCATFDAFPPPSSSLPSVTSDSFAVDCPPVHLDTASLSHHNHTSVIKQIFHSEKPSVKTAHPASSSSVSSLPTEERNVSQSRVLTVSEGDLPLDMSVVKEEEDITDYEQNTELSMGHAELHMTQHDQQSSLDPPDGSSASHSPSLSSPRSEAQAVVGAAVARDAMQFSSLTAASSMQKLQQYTEQIMHQHQLQQQQQLQNAAELSLLHTSLLASADSEDPVGRGRKRKLSELEDSRGEIGRPASWPRRDMTQKEEYQSLEWDPFMDLAEMNRLFPTMQQRTFYRWKRKIKDQFIFLEQQPNLTYTQYSQVYPQVREHVFQHWCNLLSQGHRFLGDTGKSGASIMVDSSTLASSMLKSAEGGGTGVKDGESGSESSKTNSFVSQYIFLQKNPNMDMEQFVKLCPEVPLDLFYEWKKQIITDLVKLQANPKMTYQEFRKQASVTQDVFSQWKSHLLMLASSSRLMSTGLVSAPTTSLASTSPTLPPVGLLAARAGGGANSKSIGNLATWYTSYGSLIGSMAALPFWSPLSIISNPSLAAATFPSLRDSVSGVVEREVSDKDQPSREMSGFPERFMTDKDLSRHRVDSNSNASSTKDVDVSSLLERTGGKEGSLSPVDEGAEVVEEMGHRGRRQSLKPEHYYYFLHPDTPYLDLTRHFPGVSAQRYSRWRRKVSSALAFLKREPNCSDSVFELYFPNVPDEILSSWRERVHQGHIQLAVGGGEGCGGEDNSQQIPTTTAFPHPLTSISPALSAGGQSRDSSVGAGSVGEELPRTGDGGDADRHSEDRAVVQEYQAHSHSPKKQCKASKEEYLFVQRYPSVDLSTFGKYHPQISVRTFYRWRKQVREAIDLLRSRPFVGLQDFLEKFPMLRERFPDLTEDIFKAWQAEAEEGREGLGEGIGAVQGSDGGEDNANCLLGLSDTSVLQQQQQPHSDLSVEKEESTTGQPDVTIAQPDPDTNADDNNSSGRQRPEQFLVHMNPYLNYAEMQSTYPEVSLRTFQRWKTEVHHVMDYMRNHSEVSYEDIVLAVPGVSYKAYNLWQHLIQAEKQQTKVDTDPGASHATEQRTTDSFRLNAQAGYESVSAADVLSEDTGNKSLLDGVDESYSYVGNEGDQHNANKVRRQTRDEFIQVMLNPAMDHAEFARRFGTVSQRTFYRWRAHIRDWRAAIRADPSLDYAKFSRHARDVPEYVFNTWREWESRMENSYGHDTGEDLERGQAESSQSSGGSSQTIPSTASQGGGSGKGDRGKSGVKQLDVMWTAYKYFLKHPQMDLKDMCALFPSISLDKFQSWKKTVDLIMEYIRSIPTTNFEDFHRLFPDVEEDVFNILKTTVLSEGSLSQSVDGSSNGLLLTGSSQMVFSQTGQVRGDSKQNESAVLRASEESHPAVYPALHPTVSHSMQVSPVARAKEALSVFTPTVAIIKQESSPNTPLPSFTETISNLSNLSRLNAMFQHRLPLSSTSTPTSATPAASASSSPQLNTLIHATTTNTPTSSTSSAAASVNSSFSTVLAGIVGNSQHKVVSSMPSTSTDAASQYCKAEMGSGSQHAGAQTHLYASSSVQADPSNPEVYDTKNEASRSGAQGSQLLAVAGYEDAQREEQRLIAVDTPGHSSQRQRKLQREEYMFVEQNPDVDVQEFLQRFPMVSLRTFYRWKREIRGEQGARGTIGGSIG